MNLREELLKHHSRKQADKIASYILKNPQKINDLLQIFTFENYRLSQRAAWPVGIIANTNFSILQPHLLFLIKLLTDKPVHNAVKRNITKILSETEIPSRYKGKLLKLSEEYLTSSTEPVAVKVYAMTIFYNLSKDAPDLLKELKILLEDKINYSSPGFQSRAKKILSKINKSNKLQ